MSNFTSSMTPSEMAKWSARIAADDWTWVTWKYLLGDLALILLWLSFMFVFLGTFIPKTRVRLQVASGVAINPSIQVAAFFTTWLIGDLMVAATFGSGPIAYWIHSGLGSETAAALEEWCFEYLTLIGLFLSW